MSKVLTCEHLSKTYGKEKTALDNIDLSLDFGRIVGLLGPNGSYKLSILKAADPEGTACARFFYEYPATPGLGHFLHTYVTDGNPIPTFQGEPERVAIRGDIDAFTAELWENLNPQNKISLFVRFTDLETRNFQQRIVNKYSGKETQA